jgi:hypothetical protein
MVNLSLLAPSVFASFDFAPSFDAFFVAVAV